MVKLFIVGDFHGKISNNLISRIKKENPDFILSPGDFCGNEKLSKFFFKYFYGKSEGEISAEMKKEYERMEKISFKSGVEVIKELKQLKIPIYAVHGNWDPTPYPFDLGCRVKESKKESIRKLQDNTFKLCDFSIHEEKDFILVFGGSSTSPGIVTLERFKKELASADSYLGKQELFFTFIKRRIDYSKRKSLYEKLFKKAKRIAHNRKIIFLTHNCPYKTKVDLIRKGPQKNKHFGSYLERKMIEKFQPNVVLCGHIHESSGSDKVKKSFVYNIGSSLDGRFKILSV